MVAAADGDRRTLTFPPVLAALSVITAGMMVLSVYLAFVYAPEERVMGFVQKIFYFHVPSAWVMFLAVGTAAVGSIAFLSTRAAKWDRLSDAATELALVFGALVLFSGPLWGRKAWGAYWVWDVRLTSTLVLFLTMVAAKIVRGYAGPAAKKIAAGLVVFAVINSVFVYYSVDIWRGTHPPKVIQGKLDPRMATALWTCVATFVLAYVCLLWTRLRLGVLQSSLDRAHMLATQAGLHD